MRAENTQRRLFFAIWPSASVAASLATLSQEALRDCGGRATQRADLHLTLAFLGELAPDRVAAAIAAANELKAAAFDFSLDKLGYWKHNRILWAGCAATPPLLAKLANELASRLRAAGFAFDERTFAAHVTLLRNARCAEVPASDAVWSWRVNEFVLAESRPGAGARYTVTQRWPLRVPI